MSNMSAIPELDTPRKRTPELKRPSKPEPEIAHLPESEKDVLDKSDQADSGPEKDNPLTQSRASVTDTHDEPDSADAHIDARETQVSETSAPAGEAFEVEPKQG
ncbi:MAG TPA: hypothetical protein VKB50_21500 [Vicinamibacterales bacterium]|nr:hypothetical protein [Vicinamibacterales bacterium]